MKRQYWCGLCIMAFLLAISTASVSFAQEAPLEEAEHLNEKVGELYQRGRFQDAIPLAQSALVIREKVLGPEHPLTAQSLNNLAELYLSIRALTQAEPLIERALAIQNKVLGPEHPDTASSLNNLAMLYQVAGANARAEPLFERALAIREKALGPEHPLTAQSLNNLAVHYLSIGALAQAEPLFKRVLTIQEKILGPEHPLTAQWLNNLALHYLNIGALAQAKPLFERALAIREKALDPEHPDTAQSLNNLAEVYLRIGALDQAKPLFERALAIREALGPEHPDTAQSLNNLAEIYLSIGALGQAKPLFERALEIFEKVLGPEHPNTAVLLRNLARMYMATGAYGRADRLFKRALAIQEKVLGSEHPHTAETLNYLAALNRSTGSLAQANALLERALAIHEKVLGPEHPDTATSLSMLSSLYFSVGAYAEAEPLVKRALAIREKALGPEHPHTAESLDNLAALYQSIGALDQAKPLFERALAIREKVLGPEHPLTAQSLNNLAVFYRSIGALDQAKPLFERALAIYEKVLSPDDPEMLIALRNLAIHYWAAGSHSKSEPLWIHALRINENNTARFMPFGGEVRKLFYMQKLLGDTEANVSFSLSVSDVGAKSLGLTAVLQYKGRVLDAMSDSVAQLRRSVAPADQALFDQLSGVAQQYSVLTFRGPGKLSPEAYRRQLDELAQQQEKLEGELSSRSAVFRQAVAPVTLEGVQKALPAEAVLVEFFRYKPFDPKAKDVKTRWGAPRYVAYILKHSGDPVAIDLGAAEPIEDLVVEFREALSDPQNTTYKEVAHDLSAKLIQPLHLQPDQSPQLLLSPDGLLNLVPFAALVDDEGRYLGQRHELTYLTSGRDLLRMADAPPAQSHTVVVANPAYGEAPRGTVPIDTRLEPSRSVDLDRSGLVFKPLEGTAAEAKALQKLLKLNAEDVLTGPAASEAALKQLHGPRILHVATHGFFLNDRQMAAAALKPAGFGPEAPPAPLGENPLLRSGLALAGANARHSGTNDDGILTAAEAAQLDLRGTELVVLSACETGVGQVQIGEGVYGLRRALVLAGAQTQLASLWKVADDATQELMVDYYRRLLKGEGRSAALRSAQKDMLANPATQHPYYWAAFVPIGEWAPLQGSP